MKRLLTMGIIGAVTAALWDQARRELVMEKAAAIAKIANERLKSIS